MKLTFVFALLLLAFSAMAQTPSGTSATPAASSAGTSTSNPATFDSTDPTGTPSSVNQQREEDSMRTRNNRGGNRPGSMDVNSGMDRSPGTTTTPAPATTAPATAP